MLSKIWSSTFLCLLICNKSLQNFTTTSAVTSDISVLELQSAAISAELVTAKTWVDVGRKFAVFSHSSSSRGAWQDKDLLSSPAAVRHKTSWLLLYKLYMNLEWRVMGKTAVRMWLTTIMSQKPTHHIMRTVCFFSIHCCTVAALHTLFKQALQFKLSKQAFIYPQICLKTCLYSQRLPRQTCLYADFLVLPTHDSCLL